MLNVKPTWFCYGLDRYPRSASSGVVIRHVHSRASKRSRRPLSVPLPYQPTVITGNDTWTLRTRQNGNPSLPLPPVLDPLAMKRKEKYKVPKLYKPGSEKTEVQRDLGRDVYAQALATPVRTCAFTGARLPSHFLLPVVLRFSRRSTEGDSVKSSQQSSQAAAQLIPQPLVDLCPNSDTIVSPTRVYVLNQKRVLEEINKKSRWARLANERLRKWYNLHMHRSGSEVDGKREWVWDLETPTKVLHWLRSLVREHIEQGLFGSHLSIRPLLDKLELRELDNSATACFFKLRATDHPDRMVGSEVDRGIMDERSSPPVYDLERLLGTEVTSLISGRMPKDCSWLAVSNGNMARAIQLELLKLEAFLATPSEAAEGTTSNFVR